MGPLPIESVAVSAYTIPTDAPESDGTLEWNSTTLVAVHVEGGGARGFGYGYADTATARLAADRLAPLLQGRNALDIRARWQEMVASIRNLGRPGIASMAISAVDAALWDLKGKLMNASLADLLGACREAIPAYGSGGFTSYSEERLREQLGGWADAGFRFVKMKVGRDADADIRRVCIVKKTLEKIREKGRENAKACQLFVDANGAYTRKQALAQAEKFAESEVSWFEEPVSSDDLEGLRLMRDRAPAGMAISAGEYGYDLPYFRRMLEAGAVDVLQADATRCGGVTGFMDTAALCAARGIPLSSHCAPSLHVAPCCAAQNAVHLEYFHDHARIEAMLFEGAPQPREGLLRPERARPGLGIELKARDAERFRC